MNTQLYHARQLSANVWVLAGRTNTGVIAGDDGLYLIDTGAGQGAGVQILNQITRIFGKGRHIRAILNTHSHADHTGGNAYLKRETGCEIWMPEGERGPAENNALETIIEWGGFPLPEMEAPLFTAEPAAVTRPIRHGETIPTGGGMIHTVPLPGHFLDMLGYVYTDADGTAAAFLGDGIFGRDYIKKYWIPYLLNTTEFKETLNRINGISAHYYVPGHGEISTDITGRVELNMIAVLETELAIIGILKTPHTADELVKEIADLNSMNMKVGQFVLISSTIRSYLSSLYRERRVFYTVTGNRMLWQAR
ncbi:MAG TPA: MBL fold metallo-hydrolase [Candidatus Treponema faecavium]|nr:MBL fold metallo-hydrolase [Candidatus Treponema faecavium]